MLKIEAPTTSNHTLENKILTFDFVSKINDGVDSVVSALLEERNGHAHLLRIQNHRALNLLEELRFHQFAQNISPRPHHYAQRQRHRFNRCPVQSVEGRSPSVQWNVTTFHHHSDRSLALPRLIKLWHLQSSQIKLSTITKCNDYGKKVIINLQFQWQE